MTLPSSYNPNIPQATDTLSTSQGNLLDNFQAIQALVDINHVDFASANAGKHFFIEFPIQGSAPVTAASEVGLYSATSTFTLQPELIFLKQAGSTAPITSIEFTSAGYAATGWTRLPSGILLKWGAVSPGGGGPYTVTFPVAATIPVYSAIYTSFVTPTSNIVVYVTSLTTATLVTNVSAAGSFNYLIIGV